MTYITVFYQNIDRLVKFIEAQARGYEEVILLKGRMQKLGQLICGGPVLVGNC